MNRLADELDFIVVYPSQARIANLSRCWNWFSLHNQQREQGLSRLDAILSAGRIRLRPIIMTTVAMIFGMIPLALAIGEGAEQRAPMARAVIGGLITSTLLTLFVVPTVYTLLDDAVSWVRNRRRVPDHEPIPAAGD